MIPFPKYYAPFIRGRFSGWRRRKKCPWSTCMYVNSDSSTLHPRSLRPVRYAPSPAFHGPAAPKLVAYQLTLRLEKKVPQSKVVQVDTTNNFYSCHFFLKVKVHESREWNRHRILVFILKILAISTWVNQMNWKFDHNSASSRAFQQVTTLDPTLSSSGDNGGSRIYLSPCTLCKLDVIVDWYAYK